MRCCATHSSDIRSVLGAVMQALTKPPAHRMVPSQQRPFDVPRQRVREQHLGKEAKIRVPAPLNIYVNIR